MYRVELISSGDSQKEGDRSVGGGKGACHMGRQREESLISCVQRLHLMSLLNGATGTGVASGSNGVSGGNKSSSNSNSATTAVNGRKMWENTYT